MYFHNILVYYFSPFPICLSCGVCLQDEIKSCEVDLTRLTFKQEVLQEQKELLGRFAAHISSVHSAKVRKNGDLIG